MSIFKFSNYSFVLFFQNSSSRPCCYIPNFLMKLNEPLPWSYWPISKIDMAAETPLWNALLQILSPHLLGFSEKMPDNHQMVSVCPRWTSKVQGGKTKGSLQGTWLFVHLCCSPILICFSLLFGKPCLQPYMMDLSSLLSCGWTRSTSRLTLYLRREKGRKAHQVARFWHCGTRKTIFL